MANEPKYKVDNPEAKYLDLAIKNLRKYVNYTEDCTYTMIKDMIDFLQKERTYYDQ